MSGIFCGFRLCVYWTRCFREGLPHGNLLYLGCAILLPSPAFARAGDGAVMALGTLWQDHAAKRATPPLFIISHSCLRPRRTANQKEESI